MAIWFYNGVKYAVKSLECEKGLNMGDRQLKISDVAKHFDVTRQTIYNIVKEMSKQGVKSKYISKIDGVNHVNADGVKFIADRLGVKYYTADEESVKNKTDDLKTETESKNKIAGKDEYLKKYIATLESQLKIKDDQMKIKDEQIRNLNKVIDDMHEIHKQSNFIEAMNIKRIGAEKTTNSADTETFESTTAESEIIEDTKEKKSDGLFSKIKRLFVSE